jgi:hypothetical protein
MCIPGSLPEKQLQENMWVALRHFSKLLHNILGKLNQLLYKQSKIKIQLKEIKLIFTLLLVAPMPPFFWAFMAFWKVRKREAWKAMAGFLQSKQILCSSLRAAWICEV